MSLYNQWAFDWTLREISGNEIFIVSINIIIYVIHFKISRSIVKLIPLNPLQIDRISSVSAKKKLQYSWFNPLQPKFITKIGNNSEISAICKTSRRHLYWFAVQAIAWSRAALVFSKITEIFFSFLINLKVQPNRHPHAHYERITSSIVSIWK